MAEPIKLVYRPGLNSEVTDYTNTGGYIAGNLVRFVRGFPEIVGGWRRFTADAMRGIARNIFPFTILSGARLYAVGTEEKYYIVNGIELNDITPIRLTLTLANNPFTTTNASTTVVVTHVGHDAGAGDFVTYSGATAVGGVTIVGEYQITTVIDPDSYTITSSTAAASGATGGGAAVSAAYQINIGSNTTTLGLGFGTGPYSEGGYGEPSAPIETDVLRRWSQDAYGEDLVACRRDGPIYYYDVPAGPAARLELLSSLAGAADVPVIARQIMVATESRHVIAFGANSISDSVQDYLLVRWSDRENATVWTPSTTTTAGSLRLDAGSRFITAVKMGAEIMVFTDTSLHTMRFVGTPFFFGQIKVSDEIALMGPGAVLAVATELIWMGVSKFYMFNGQVQELPCDVETYVFNGLNFEERDKVEVGFNSVFGEVTWLYPADNSPEVNAYVTYNIVEKTWSYGSFGLVGRSAWLDVKFEKTPLAAGTDGYLYLHETGSTDGSVSPPGKLNDWLEASPMEIGDGDDFMICSRIIPDIAFDGSSASSPAVDITIEMVDAPGAGPRNTPRSTNTPRVSRTAVFPVMEHTVKKDLAVRGRSMKYRISSTVAGTKWRQGTHRLYIAPDGKR